MNTPTMEKKLRLQNLRSFFIRATVNRSKGFTHNRHVWSRDHTPFRNKDRSLKHRRQNSSGIPATTGRRFILSSRDRNVSIARRTSEEKKEFWQPLNVGLFFFSMTQLETECTWPIPQEQWASLRNYHLYGKIFFWLSLWSRQLCIKSHPHGRNGQCITTDWCNAMTESIHYFFKNLNCAARLTPVSLRK